MEYWRGGVMVTDGPPNTPSLQLSLPWRPQQQTQNRGSEQRAAEQGERQPIAAGEIEQKTEKRRPGSGQNLRDQQTQAANLAERAATEIVRPQNIGQNHIAAQSDTIKKKSRIETKDISRRDRQAQPDSLNHKAQHRHDP